MAGKRSPITREGGGPAQSRGGRARWKLGALVGGLVLGLFGLATSTASAQDIVILTPESPRATSTIIGKTGGAFHEYWVDYKAGAWVDVRITPHSDWYAITANRRLRSRDFFGAEVWTPRGRIDRADFRRQTPSSAGCVQRYGPRAGGNVDRNCWQYRTSGADLVDLVDGRYLIKVYSYIDRAVPYTLEARGLNYGEAVPGAPEGGEGPYITAETPSTRGSIPRYTGTLPGPGSPNQGVRSVYYTLRAPGGGSSLVGGNAADIEFTFYPVPPQSQWGMIGANMYRGTRLLQTTRGAGPSFAPAEGLDINTSPQGSVLQGDIKINTEQPELLTIEIFNGIPGFQLNYAIINKS